MTLGRQGERQADLMVGWAELPRSPGHAFYDRLQAVLVGAGFDRFAEGECAPHYASRRGRPSIPAGRYFRMHLVGYFEGIDSERGLEWRCADSLSLREFLRLGTTEPVPDHSWLMWTATECQPISPSPRRRVARAEQAGGSSFPRRSRTLARSCVGRSPTRRRPSRQVLGQPRQPSGSAGSRQWTVWSGQVRPYVRPVARPMPLAIMGVRSRARHQSERRARGAAKSTVSPGLSRPQPFPSRRSALPAGPAGLASAASRTPERHATTSAAVAARPFAR
jgi:hypothetical protein